MKYFLSYCGLTDARMRASEKDLPVETFLLLKRYIERPADRAAGENGLSYYARKHISFG